MRTTPCVPLILGLALSLAASLRAQTVYIPGGTSGIGASTNGNVGIGTSSPGYPLTVSSSGLQPLTINSTGSSGPLLTYLIGGTQKAFIGMDGGSLTTGASQQDLTVRNDGTSGQIRFNLGNSTKAIIDASGNVGIGTVSPLARMHVDAGSPGTANPAVVLSGKQEGALYSYGGIRSNGFQQSGQPYSGGLSLQRYWYNGTTYNFEDVLNVTGSGNVGIGTTNPTFRLAVNGTIRAKEVIVDTGWSDYVFADNYRLAPLSEVEAHIKAEKHLPGIPSAADVAAGGTSLGDMQAKLLSKVEELTLHIIAQEKRIELLEQENNALRSKSSHP